MTTLTVHGVANAKVETNNSDRGDWYTLTFRHAAGTLIAQVDVFGYGVDKWASVQWSFDDEALNWHKNKSDNVA